MERKSDLAGVLAIIAATAVFVLGDTFLKAAAQELPPVEALFLRNVVACLGCAALMIARGEAGRISGAWHPRALARAAGETAATLLYVIALARMPIADLLAIAQVAPLIVILGAGLLLRERVGPARAALALAGFAGALMVAQPGGGAATTPAWLALGAAVFIAARDLVGRGVPAAIPVSVVALSTMTMEAAAAGGYSLVIEAGVAPGARHLAFLAVAGVCVVLGQVAILAAYRWGRTATVAPFFYSFALWGLLAGYAVWGQVPNALALAGIALIVASGIAIVASGAREGRAVALTEAL